MHEIGDSGELESRMGDSNERWQEIREAVKEHQRQIEGIGACKMACDSYSSSVDPPMDISQAEQVIMNVLVYL